MTVHQRSCRGPAEVSLLSLIFLAPERPLLARNTSTNTRVKLKQKTKRTPNTEKESTNHFFFYYCFLSLTPSILFCFVLLIMGVNLYMSFQKYYCFWLEKRGLTYTNRLFHENMYVKCSSIDQGTPKTYYM